MKDYANLDDFLADLPQLAAPFRDRLVGRDALFQLTTETRQLFVQIADGHVSLTDGHGGKPAAVVSAKESVLTELLSGKLSPMGAILRGRVKVTGNIGALTGLIALLKD